MDLEKIFNVGTRGFTDGSVSFFSPLIVELTGYEMEEFNSKAINWMRDLMLRKIRRKPEALIKGV